MKRKGNLLLAFVLAVCAVLATPALDGAAKAVDVSKSCTLTVSPGGADFAEDLAKANVVIDLYKVADAVEDDGYDTYNYKFLGGYTGLKYSGKPDNAEWTALAKEAAKIALNGDSPVIKDAPVNKAMNIPGCGLYLIIARGADIADYVTAEGNTIARTPEYTYTFAPSLVSLPSKEADENGNINTAGDGEWIYDLSVTLKPERDQRNGSLEIVKTLQTYESKDPATFVFEVNAVLDGRLVYSDVVSLSFTQPGQKSKLIENLPVGAVVTVKEIYSGAVYQLVTAEEQTVEILANEVAYAAFTNDYDNSDKGGGAVINQFDYDAKAQHWNWTQHADTE